METEVLPYAPPNTEAGFVTEPELQKSMLAQDAREKLCFNVALGCGIIFVASVANTCIRYSSNNPDVGIDLMVFSTMTSTAAAYSAWRSGKLKNIAFKQYAELYPESEGLERYGRLACNKPSGTWKEKLAGYGTGVMIISTMNENLEAMLNLNKNEIMESGITFSVMMLAVAMCWRMRVAGQQKELGQAR